MKKKRQSRTTSALTKAERYALMAESLADERTIVRVYDGLSTHEMTYERVSRAAKKLGIPVPARANLKRGR